jgi:hypothetical protein
VAACSKGGGVKVDGGGALRGRQGRGRRRTNGLRKRMAAACSKDGVEATVCSGAGNEAAACSRAEIEDGRW